MEEVAPDSPAASAGIEPGDVIVSINEKPIDNTGELQRYIHLNLGKEIAVVVKHSNATTEEVYVTPRWKPPEDQGATGIKIYMPNPSIIQQHYPLWQVIPLGVNECIETFLLFKNEIMSWFARGTVPPVAGPVGIAQIAGEAAQVGISPLLEFAAFLSINLAIINILPLPALDGGRIMFVLLEWVRRGRRISPKAEGLVHLIGFAMLMGLVALITYQDIIRIISGGSLMP